MIPAAALLQGIARILCGDLDGGDASLEIAVSGLEEVGASETLAFALCERSLVAMARGEWSRAGALAAQAGSVLVRAGIEDSHAMPLLCAARARVALHRGDVPAVRRELVTAQRLRHLLTYAVPHLAVQARIELARAHLALADLAGARTLMGEIDELLRRRPDLGTLVGETEALRAQLSRQRGSGSPGASALTAAELRVLPLLASHLPAAEIAAELSVSAHTIKSQQASLYRKLGTSSRSQAVARARQLGLLEGCRPGPFTRPGRMSRDPAPGGMAARRCNLASTTELPQRRQAMPPGDPGLRNEASHGDQPGTGGLPGPLRRFADRLDEVRSAGTSSLAELLIKQGRGDLGSAANLVFRGATGANLQASGLTLP